MMLSRKEALLMVDRAMVRIRRSQSRRTVGQLMRKRLGPHISLANISVADAIQELTEAGVPEPTITGMAASLGIDLSRASRMTAGAIRAGFARRIASQSDGRRSHLELTSEGLKALEMTRQFRMAFFSRLISDWSDGECATFAKLLIRFTDSLPDAFGRNTRLREPKQTAGEASPKRRSAKSDSLKDGIRRRRR